MQFGYFSFQDKVFKPIRPRLWRGREAGPCKWLTWWNSWECSKRS